MNVDNNSANNYYDKFADNLLQSSNFLTTGKGVYQFNEKTGVTDDPINIYYYRPTTWVAGDDIAFVLHGTNRDAERYLNDWTSYSIENNVLVICPEFTNEKYPGSRYYNTGNIMDSTNGTGTLQPKEDWVFPAINRIVEDLKLNIKSFNSKTLLYGHSAGAQMVHRYAIFNDATNFDLIISANAGWYTMPDDDITFPYGVSNIKITDTEWTKIFEKPVVVLLGENDTIRDSNLRVTEEADKQGENRLERGKKFYEEMENKAHELEVPFNWQLITVPEVGHTDRLMAKTAMEIFLNAPLSSTFLIVGNSTKSPVTLDAAIKTVDASARTKSIKLTGNASANSIVGGSGNDKLFGLAGNDTLSGYTGNDTLTGGDGNDSLSGGKGKDLFVYTAGNDIIADYASGDKISLGASIDKASVSGSNVIFTTAAGTLTVKNGKDKALAIAATGGKSYSATIGATDSMNIKVSNKMTSTVTLDAAIKTVDASKRTKSIKLTGNASANSIIGGSGKNTLSGGAGNDTLTGGSTNDFLSGGSGNDKLFGLAGNDTLSGYTGNDTLTGGDGNDSLNGGKGKDLFVYTAGNDIIADYAAGDKISVGGAISKASVNGKNVVLTVGKGTLTVKNAKGKTLALTDSKGRSYTAVVSASNAMKVTLTDSTPSTVTLDAAIKTVDASNRTEDVKIVGNASANSIVGGAGFDTLIGGKGNDSLWGGAGSDTFIYSSGDGKDVISGFGNNDLLQITGGNVTASYSKSDKSIAFKVGKTASAITLRDFTATTFHVNSTTYRLSGGKLIKS